jgi:hypothetical protein
VEAGLELVSLGGPGVLFVDHAFKFRAHLRLLVTLCHT